MITRLKDLIDLFRAFADEHPELNDFGWGMTFDVGKSRPMKMPYLWVTHRAPSRITAQNRNQTVYWNFSFIIVDKINIQKNVQTLNGFESDNSSDILDSTHLITQDFITYLMRNGVLIEGDVSIDLVYDETDDKVAGWLADMSIKLKFKNCIIPNDQ
jgi:hypothetical protein